MEAINRNEQIKIRTQNSEYSFWVVDPDERRGKLSGGSLGEQTREAVLVGTLASDNQSLENVSTGLKTGRRALFYLAAKNGVERLITSIITGISRSSERLDGKRAA